MAVELSRCQHLPLLALAYRQTRDPTYRSAVESQCASWQCANPVEIGVNWRCTMDVAIRAANWAVALALLTDGGERSAWVDNALARVLEHVRFVSRTLEFGAVRGNHDVADLAGLVVAAAPFADSPEGRHYLHRAASLLSREMESRRSTTAASMRPQRVTTASVASFSLSRARLLERSLRTRFSTRMRMPRASVVCSHS